MLTGRVQRTRFHPWWEPPNREVEESAGDSWLAFDESGTSLGHMDVERTKEVPSKIVMHACSS